MNAQQARQYIKDAGENGPDCYPIAHLNDAGREAVKKFVFDHAKDPERHNLIAWDDDAETQAEDLLNEETATVEMSGRMSMTGNPVTLTITEDMVEFNV